MRRSLPFLVLLLATAAACSKSSSDRSPPYGQPAESSASNAVAAEASESAAPRGASRDGGPNIGVTAAPGVAFNYRYEFRLPPDKISEVQEQHAQMCEQLTVARCRITGMFYRVNNAHNVEAMMAFRLDPSVARLFGRTAVGRVTDAGGMLSESEISGTDVGSQIQTVSRSIAELQADLQRIEARLREPRLDPNEKAQLDEQAQELREQIRAAGAQREEQRASLATTPMEFRYASGEPTIGQSLRDTGDDFLDSAELLLKLVIRLLPWAVAGLIVWAIVAFVRRRWFPRKAIPGETEASAQPD